MGEGGSNFVKSHNEPKDVLCPLVVSPSTHCGHFDDVADTGDADSPGANKTYLITKAKSGGFLTQLVWIIDDTLNVA